MAAGNTAKNTDENTTGNIEETAGNNTEDNAMREEILPADFVFPEVDDADWTDEEFAAVLAGELDPNDIPRMHYEKEHGVKVVFGEPGSEAEVVEEVEQEPIESQESESESMEPQEPEVEPELPQESDIEPEQEAVAVSEPDDEPDDKPNDEPVTESQSTESSEETTPEQKTEVPETDSDGEMGALE